MRAVNRAIKEPLKFLYITRSNPSDGLMNRKQIKTKRNKLNKNIKRAIYLSHKSESKYPI